MIRFCLSLEKWKLFFKINKATIWFSIKGIYTNEGSLCIGRSLFSFKIRNKCKYPLLFYIIIVCKHSINPFCCPKFKCMSPLIVWLLTWNKRILLCRNNSKAVTNLLLIVNNLCDFLKISIKIWISLTCKNITPYAFEHFESVCQSLIDL